MSQSLGVFQAGEELEAFRRAFSKDLLDTTTPRSLGSPRPTRLLELLPVAPWCGQCLPQAPDGQLAIKPEEISLGQHSDLRALTENIEEYGILDRSEKRSRDRRACRREEVGALERVEIHGGPSILKGFAWRRHRFRWCFFGFVPGQRGVAQSQHEACARRLMAEFREARAAQRALGTHRRGQNWAISVHFHASVRLFSCLLEGSFSIFRGPAPHAVLPAHRGPARGRPAAAQPAALPLLARGLRGPRRPHAPGLGLRVRLRGGRAAAAHALQHRAGERG